ncbi:MAG TPA: hypothetical protein VK982_02075, partial [Bacteroidales bacterium]|nr:hypothetical protein [Bacteroidales bacterium]
IKSNALLSDNSPVSKINLDNGTFKFGDDVSTNPKYISYDGNNLTLVGGNVISLTDTNISVTVGDTTPVSAGGQGADFATLNEALEYMSKFRIIKKADNSTLSGNITIKSGHIINYSINLYNVDLSWVSITAEDSNVSVNISEFRFIDISNSKAPFISGFVFENISTTNFPDGLVMDNSTIMLSYSGFKNFNNNIRAQNNSFLGGYNLVLSNAKLDALTLNSSNAFLGSVDFSNALNYAIQAQNSCKVIATESNFDFCDDAIICSGNSTLDISGSDLQQATGAIEISELSFLNAKDCLFHSFVSPNIIVSDGGIINAKNVTGANFNQTTNTITGNGIIFN